MRIFLISLFCCLCSSSFRSAHASEVDALRGQMQDLTRAVQDLRLTVENQQCEIAFLKGQTPPPFTTTGQPSSASGTRNLQGRWNPDIGIVADIVAKLDSPKADSEGSDRLSAREVELIFGSSVDPYSRFDATISFSDFEEAGLEEATLTRFELPLDMKARVGRFKPVFGKALPVHRDSLETVDEPLMIQRYFGPEGYNRSGADLHKVLDLPWPSVHAVSVGVLEGSVGEPEAGRIFGNSRRHPTLYSHLKNYWDLTDLTNFELGLSHMMGSKDADAHWEVHLLAADATLLHRLNADQSLKLQGELFHMNREETFTFNEDLTRDTADLDGSLWASYVLTDFRFNPQWATGFRFDHVELIDNARTSPDHADLGYTGYLTFYQSEFARWRIQYSHIDLANAEDDNQLMLQGTFAIGEHKHKIQ